MILANRAGKAFIVSYEKYYVVIFQYIIMNVY